MHSSFFRACSSFVGGCFMLVFFQYQHDLVNKPRRSICKQLADDWMIGNSEKSIQPSIIVQCNNNMHIVDSQTKICRLDCARVHALLCILFGMRCCARDPTPTIPYAFARRPKQNHADTKWSMRVRECCLTL